MSNTPIVDKLVAELSEMGITPAKTKTEMEKQLKKAKKRLMQEQQKKEILEKQKLREAKPHPFDYYFIFDVEGTCIEGSDFVYESEIIEFPVIVYNNELKEIATFHRYVRPLLNPVLSDFCKELTGISQNQVDDAAPFDVVYKEFNAWMKDLNLERQECCFVTDGPWDLRDFITKEFTYYSITRPEYMYNIIDIRKAFTEIYNKPAGSLNDMLLSLGMNFEGREHSGIDDARNIARIFCHIAKLKRMETNTNLRKHKPKRGNWSKLRKPSALG